MYNLNVNFYGKSIKFDIQTIKKRIYIERSFSIRKFLSFACFAVVLSAGAFAKETVQNLDFSVPVDSRELDFDDEKFKKDLDEKSTSFDFDYSMMTINENGFSFVFGANVGFTSTKIENLVDDNFEGLDLGLKLGWGGLPVNTNNFLLAFHGFFGFGFRSLKLTESYVDYKATFFNIKLGADVVAIYRFTDTFGINASLDFFTNLPATGSVNIEGDNFDESYGFFCAGGIGVVPKVGVSLFF